MKENKGVFGKYIISKSDGSSVDTEACYFVLRLDKDEAACKAMRVYAEECGNEKLAADIHECLNWLKCPPVCTCGERDSEWRPFKSPEICALHAVWRHG